MNKILKLFFIIAIIGISPAALAGNKDTIVHDTLILPQEDIIPVALHCNGPDVLLKITSYAELEKIFGDNCPPAPVVDFTKEMLLYFPIKASGCKAPDYIRTVKIIHDTLIYHVLIIQHGECKAIILNQNCIAIPNKYSNYRIDFKYDVITENQ